MKGDKMSYIKPTEKLPSGIKGWNIFSDTIGELFMYFSNSDGYSGHNGTHTKEDVIFIRNLLNKALANWDKGSGNCENCEHFIEVSGNVSGSLAIVYARRTRDKYCGDFHSGRVVDCKKMKWK